MILVHPKKKNDFTNIVIMILDFSLLVLPVKLMPLISIASILVSILITTWEKIGHEKMVKQKRKLRG